MSEEEETGDQEYDEILARVSKHTDEARANIEAVQAEAEPEAETGAEAFVAAALKAEKKQADILVEIAKRGELFHTSDGVAYADIVRDGHRETYPVRSEHFKKWLRHSFYKENSDCTPNKDALASAIGVIEAMAAFEGKEYPVATRIGGHDGKIYLDLCNDRWQAIEIDADGWRLVDEPPIRFVRSSGMLPLPMPERGGKTKDVINSLRKFINIREGDDFALVKAWVLGAFYDHGPYPVLALIARHGAAKSTILRVLRALVDPNTADLRSPPRSADDLYITATKSHLLPIDNVSSLPEWLSDALCRIATGMSYAKRTLYTDQDEVLIKATRPIALTSVVEVIEAADLGDRSITAEDRGWESARGSRGACQFREGASKNPGGVPRCGGARSKDAARHHGDRLAAHGGLRQVGDRL